MILKYVTIRNTEEEIGIVPNGVNKIVQQSSKDSFAGFFF